MALLAVYLKSISLEKGESDVQKYVRDEGNFNSCTCACEQGCLRWEDRRGSCPVYPHQWGARRARNDRQTELFTSLLFSEEAFSGIVDSLV